MVTDIFSHPITIALFVALAINLVMFLIAFRFQSDKLTDASYAITFAVIALWAFVRSPHNWLHVVLLIMVLAWALRLGGFLLYRILHTGRDTRFDDMRRSFWRFGKFWLGQAVAAWVLLLPYIFTSGTTATPQLSALSLLGVAVWLVGFVCESIADLQKLRFKKDPQNKNKWIETGIWRYSRHPNYFGEILVWVGAYLCALPVITPLQAVIGLASPALIFILLVFVSGIPPLEKAADARWGEAAGYKRYKKRTSILIPLPPKE